MKQEQRAKERERRLGKEEAEGNTRIRKKIRTVSNK